jgi:thiamine pyrophosphokinase
MTRTFGNCRLWFPFPSPPVLRYCACPMTLFTILLGGDLAVTPRLEAATAGARYIAADGGMRHAQALGVTPELWVGDFDSSTDSLKNDWPDVERLDFPPAKAATDGELAVQVALERGATALILAGALGGERSDHALMHLLHACHLAESGLDVRLTSGTEEAYPLLPGDCDLDLPGGSLFSVLGLTALTGLTLANVRYPLQAFDLAFGSTRTISNIAEGPVRLSLQSGRGILLARPYDMTGA